MEKNVHKRGYVSLFLSCSILLAATMQGCSVANAKEAEDLQVGVASTKTKLHTELRGDYLVFLPFMDGYDDKTFQPSLSLTYEEVATSLNQIFYPDAYQGELMLGALGAQTHIEFAFQQGLLTYLWGVDGERLSERLITRAEFVTLICAYQGEALAAIESVLCYSDVDDSYWAMPAISYCTRKGWICGDTDEAFRPDDPLSRIEFAIIMQSMLERDCDMSIDSQYFVDIPTDYWGYHYVTAATSEYALLLTSENFEFPESTEQSEPLVSEPESSTAIPPTTPPTITDSMEFLPVG